MALLKSYSCIKCGGVLNFDEGQEVFGCPFCGGEFAFTDFHRGDLLEQAGRSLEKGNYSTAKDKYQSILRRNPRDFEALKGLIFAEGRISSEYRLCRIEYLENADLKEAVAAAEKAKEDLKEEAGYFDLLIRMFTLASEYHRNSDAADETAKVQNKHFRDMGYQLMTIEEEEETAFEGYKKVGGFLALRVLIFVIAITAYFDVWWVSLIFIGVYVLIGVIMKLCYVIMKRRIEKKLSSEMQFQNDKDDAAKAGLLDIRHDYMNAYYKLKRIVPDPKAYEKPVPAAKKESSESADPFADIEKNVVCSKCSGQLILDKEKNLYVCRSCGVAYGSSLFFGDPAKKAREALKENDYTEAGERFSHILMTDPDNYEALLGRILCAGKWKKVNDIALPENPVNDVRLKALRERASEAVLHVSEEDRPAMEDIRKLVGLYCDYASSSQEARNCNNRLEYISKNRLTLLADKEDRSPLDEEENILKQRREALMITHKAKAEFDELKAKVLRDNIKRIKPASDT